MNEGMNMDGVIGEKGKRTNPGQPSVGLNTDDEMANVISSESCESETAVQGAAQFTRPTFAANTVQMTVRSPPPAPDFEEDLEHLCRTLDKSRKRHLSVGLLRGDEVQDRLVQQEASASPLLKKTRKSVLQPPQLVSVAEKPQADNMAMTLADFESYMERNTNKRLDGIDERIESGLASVRKSVGKLEISVADNSSKIAASESLIKANQTNIEELKSEMLVLRSARPADPPLPPPARPTWTPDVEPVGARNLPPADLDAYNLARRSLRLWPIHGGAQAELWQSVRNFLYVNPQLSGQIQENAICKIERPASTSGAGAVQEALVVFSEVSVRDKVMGAAGKLAPFTTPDGKTHCWHQDRGPAIPPAPIPHPLPVRPNTEGQAWPWYPEACQIR